MKLICKHLRPFSTYLDATPKDLSILRSVSLLYDDSKKQPRELVLQVKIGDITQERVDAIVNAANGKLRHGGGLAAAIVKRGGKEVQEESD